MIRKLIRRKWRRVTVVPLERRVEEGRKERFGLESDDRIERVKRCRVNKIHTNDSPPYRQTFVDLIFRVGHNFVVEISTRSIYYP